jgi:hypothetical protein
MLTVAITSAAENLKIIKPYCCYLSFYTSLQIDLLLWRKTKIEDNWETYRIEYLDLKHINRRMKEEKLDSL